MAVWEEIVLFFALTLFVVEILVLQRKKRRSEASFPKYTKSGLRKEVSLEYKDKLNKLMNSEKPFLDPNFKLNDLSLLLGLSRHHTSQLINEHYQKNFFDFINHYRISTSCSILSHHKVNDPKETIIEAAYKAGFNNKASFYKAFRKFVGTTPTEFIKGTD